MECLNPGAASLAGPAITCAHARHVHVSTSAQAAITSRSERPCESERARCGAACERGGNHLPLSASGRRPTAQPSRALIGMQKHDVTCAVEVAALKDVSGSQEMVD